MIPEAPAALRFLSEPLTWVLVALALDRLLDGARALRRRARTLLPRQSANG